MAKLKLNLTYEKPSLLNVPVTRNIKRCVEATLDAEGITALCEINILITDDIGIHGINKAARKEKVRKAIQESKRKSRKSSTKKVENKKSAKKQ